MDCICIIAYVEKKISAQRQRVATLCRCADILYRITLKVDFSPAVTVLVIDEIKAVRTGNSITASL